MRARFTTLGCRLNRAEAEEAQSAAVAAGWTLVDSAADLHVVHTCTVTATAAKKSRQAVARAKREAPNAQVVANGCAVALPSSLVADLADLALPALSALATWPANLAPLAPRAGSHRAVLKIQDGCDDHCTYCVIPLTRGANRSRPIAELVERANAAFAAGYRELVLTGVSVGGYGAERTGGPSLAGLVQDLLRETQFGRIRIASVEPQDVDEPLLAVWESERVAPHVHLCLQSGSDAVLRRMGRRYTVARYAEIVAALRTIRPGCRITSDVIAGFPGETADDHCETIRVTEKLALDGLHVFPFSARAETPAARLAARVAAPTARSRASELRMVAERLLGCSVNQRLGGRAQVLCERRTPGGWLGYTEDYLEVVVSSPLDLESRIVRVRLSLGESGVLHGVLEETA